MKNKIKQIVIMLLAICISLSNVGGVNAVAKELQLSIQTYDCSKPDSNSVWDISKDGTYTIEGSTQGADLYTLYRFKGVTKYSIKVTNNGTSTVKVYTVKTLSKKQATIEPGKSKTFTYEPGSKTKKFYLKFKGKSINVSGTIKKK